jgi:HD-GYP domain-containing protein (c-di-GMP phosphodiesterase class II)
LKAKPNGHIPEEKTGGPAKEREAGYRLFEDVVKALSLTMDLVEQATNEHAIRVASITFNLGRHLGEDKVRLRNIYYAGLLHDIGQIGTPDDILRKPKNLTISEQAAIWMHPHVGYEIIREVPTLAGAANLIRWHHERWDGTGYPDGLLWEEIPLGAQLLCICDALDALLSPRPWRQALPMDDAIKELTRFQGMQFSPGYVAALLDLVESKGFESLTSIDEASHELLKRVTVADDDFKNLSGQKIMNIVGLFSRIIDARHKYTRGHSRRVASLSKEIGAELGLSDIDLFKLEIAGLLHDAGKVKVPSRIIDKVGKLTDDEREIIWEYPLVSERIVSTIGPLFDLGKVVRHHHERFDGSGYPDGLKGEEIPLFSRILAVADSYDAMATDRAYRKALPMERIIREMQKGFGTGHFDPALDRFFRGESEGGDDE